MGEEKSKCLIYGVDISQPITPLMVRDAVVLCFTEAHAKELNDLKNYGELSSEEFERMKQMNVEGLVQKTFKDTGGDYNQPTKDSLLNMVQGLAEYAKNFRDQKVIAEHYQKIMNLIDLIK